MDGDSVTALLEATGVVKSFAGVQALRGVDFAIYPGEIHALLGENGAGKSTLIKIISGVQSADSGSLRVNGQVAELSNAKHAEELGIFAIHQQSPLVKSMSVLDNFLVGPTGIRRAAERRGGFISRRSIGAAVTEALGRVGLNIDLSSNVSSLSLPDAQLVQIARTLSADARVLLLDEPTASLAVADRDRLFKRLNELRNHGVGLVYVSHRLDEIEQLCDGVTVMRDGRVVDSIRGHGNFDVERIITLMLDRPVESLYPTRPADITSETVLVSENVQYRSDAPPLSLSVKSGEILGLTGLIGAGMVEFAETLAGLRIREGGSIRIDGVEVDTTSPSRAIAAGICVVPGDRTLALVPEMSTEQNLAISLGACRRVSGQVRGWGGSLSSSGVRSVAQRAIVDFGIRPPNAALPVKNLSGGNAQKVVLARAVALEPRVLVLIDPTAGVDVGARADIYGLLRRLCDRGLAVLLVSSDFQEVSGLSDRIIVFRRGLVEAKLPGEVGEETIMRHASSGAAHV